MMSEWPKWLDHVWYHTDMATEALVREALACDVCEGSGKLLKPAHRIATEPCGTCHGTGLAGVEWHCVSDLHWDQCRSVRSWGLQGDIDEHADCRMRLIVDLERSE